MKADGKGLHVFLGGGGGGWVLYPKETWSKSKRTKSIVKNPLSLPYIITIFQAQNDI